MTDEDDDDNPPLHPHQLTWAALLSQWISFARKAVALPDDPHSQKLRDSVTDLIMLQAVYCALDELDQLDRDQRALGLDRAELLIEKHTNALHQRWSNETMPETMRELIDDAHQRLRTAQSADSEG